MTRASLSPYQKIFISKSKIKTLNKNQKLSHLNEITLLLFMLHDNCVRDTRIKNYKFFHICMFKINDV